MARTVADLEAFYRVLAGWDTVDPFATTLPAAVRLPGPDEWRVGWFDAHPDAPVSADTAATVQQAVAGLEQQGLRADPVRPAALDRARDLWHVFFCEMGDLLLRDALGAHTRDLPILQAYFAARQPGVPIDAARLARAWIDRDVVRAALLEEMREHHVLVCPVTSIPAFGHGQRRWVVAGGEVGYLDAMLYTQWFNVLGNPAAVVPVGRSVEGLPIGVQVVGRPFEETKVLQVAAAIERACGGFIAPPVTG
jgi:Asp-tRNA(Asn)/Glu-tRNA(Gln) amidotransferase A subunit family amidase